MKRIVSRLLLALLAGGGAVAAAAASPAVTMQPGILIVGTMVPLGALDDRQRAELYDSYARFASHRQSEALQLSPAAFQAKVAGWTSIRTFGGALLATGRFRVLLATTSPKGAKGDLVAARSDRDGLVWVERVLCKADRSLRACTQKYQPGLFDENTGRELGRDYRPKADGEWVDISSYVRLSKDPGHHSASELDVRAINRCDDCKGSLPGSVQSSVPVPPTR